MINTDTLDRLLDLASLLTNYNKGTVYYKSTGAVYTEDAEAGSFYRYLESVIPLEDTDAQNPVLYKHDIPLQPDFNIVNGYIPVYAYEDGFFLCTAEHIVSFEKCPYLLLECVYQIDSLQREEGFSGWTSESVTGHSVSRAVNSKTGIPAYLNTILDKYRVPVIEDINDKTTRCL